MNLKKNLEKNKALIREALVSLTTILFLTIIVAVITYISTRPVAEIIRNSVTFLWGCFVMVFLWYQGILHKNLEYDNIHHPLRFLIVFVICFFASIAMIYLPTSTWIFLSIMVLLSMFSNSLIGLTAGSLLLLITASLSNSSNMYIFFLYFMIGLMGVSFFHNLGLDFQVAGPMVLSCIGSFVLQVAYIVIFENQPFSLNAVFFPLLNLFGQLSFEH